jgi:hypothetical protein
MNEIPNNLETELQRMRPAALPADLIARISDAIENDSPSPWAQRRLLGAIWAGSLAACVIVTMLFMQNESSISPGVPLNVSNNVANVGGPTVALALADPKWIDSLK